MDWLEAERAHTDGVIGETTIPRLFFDAVERFGDDACQLYKGGIRERSLETAGIVSSGPAGDYAELTYAAVGDIVRNLAAGFHELGVEPDDRVAIYADTRMEWAQCDIALQARGAVVTTVYTESSAPQVRYLLSDPGASGVVVGTEELLETLLEVDDDLDLEFIVVLDEVDEPHAALDDLYTLADVHEIGSDAFDPDTFESWLDDRDWESLSSLVYTSGTTGDPKGVELTHKNWRTALNQVRKRIGPRPDKPADVPVVDNGSVSLAFLPLAHAFERMNHFYQLGSGVTIAYAESPDTVGDDIQLVRPTGAAAVPRVYERIYSQMREQASESPLKKRIFEWAVATGLAYDDVDDPGVVMTFKHRIADRLVFSQVREALGGNIELFISGGGSLSKELAKLYRSMGITIVEGYGLTETAPALTMNPPEAIRIGTIGPALCDIQTKLDPDMVDEETKESVPGDVGELLAKGPNVFEAYWNKPDETESSFTDDGWFRTGDIVARDDDGYFTFVDRVKNLIVLDTGKNIAPEPIEDEFATSGRVEQIMVIGQDQKFIAAVIVPNFEGLRSWAEEENLDLPRDREALCEDQRVIDWIDEEVSRVNERLAHHERIKEFRLVPEEWTPDNDLLTPSMKKKRRNIRDVSAQPIADIYDIEDEEAEVPA